MMDVIAVLRKRVSLSIGGQTVVYGGPDETRLCVDDWERCDSELRRRAYEISQARPGARPDPQSDWLQAEAELLGRRFLGLS